MPQLAHAHAAIAMHTLLVGVNKLVGVTSLATGSDQLFATEVLNVGGALHVVVPCSRYEETFDDHDRGSYRSLLAAAAQVRTLPFEEPSEKAFYAAGRAVVDASDWLCAVWDGQPAVGLGGSADVVAYAREQGKHVEVLWPTGLTR
jgi:hypothetical protein